MAYKKKAGFIVLSALMFSGCVKLIYGLNEPKAFNETSIQNLAREYKIPSEDLFELDTAYISFIRSLDTSVYKYSQKNHLQPLQAHYYDNKGTLRVFMLNCYAGGIPNMKWNRNHALETFLPKQQAPLDSILPLELHLNYLKPISNAAGISTDSEYTVIIYWSHYMGRQSKRLIKAIQENVRLAPSKKIRIIYVNTDNVLVKL